MTPQLLPRLCGECRADLADVNDTGICEDCRALLCPKCDTVKQWRHCHHCEDGFSHHDCGEDCCPCLYPEDNVPCDVCDGNGGWHACPNCYPGQFND